MDLLAALTGDEGTVDAVIHHIELHSFDANGGVSAGHHSVCNHQFAGIITPDGQYRVPVVNTMLVAAQIQHQAALVFRDGAPDMQIDQGAVDQIVTPRHFKNNGFRQARFQDDIKNRPGRLTPACFQLFQRGLCNKNLVGIGGIGQISRNVDRIPVNIIPANHHRPCMQSDTNLHCQTVGLQCCNGPLHVHRGIHRAVRIGKQAHHGVAQRFDQPAMVIRKNVLHRGQTGIDDFQRLNIAKAAV